MTILVIAIMFLHRAEAQPTNVTSASVLNGGCLTDLRFCLNDGKCGINGNCICPRYYYGQRCQEQIVTDKRVTFESHGIG